MKYLLIGLLAAMAVTGRAQQRKQYKIGDSAFCGVVFHVQQTDTTGRQRILVCSLTDQVTAIAWHNGPFVATAAVKGYAFDKANADRVIKVQAGGSYAASAARMVQQADSACRVKDSLWYLPSRAELQLMYQRLDSTGRLRFAREGYWSSVEFSNGITKGKKTEKKAWIVDFFNGKTFAVNKSNKYHVRAVHEFGN